jgi:hypothetical protein
VLQLLGAGLVIVLSYRLVLAVLGLEARPDREYPLAAWLANALVLQVAVVTLAIVVVAGARLERVREIMAAFAVCGLGLALAAEVTRAVDFGFVAGRWGLTPVWGLFGLYPVLALPFHASVGALVGWAWARRRRGRPWFELAGVFVGSAVLLAVFNSVVVRDPFSGFPWLFVALGLCVWAAGRAGDQGEVARLPPRLLADPEPREATD